MIVTDFVSQDPKWKDQKGFYMDGYLASNIIGIDKYLAKDWDAVGIFSGHGQVRIGKSTIAFQVATLVAWLLAGGKMKFEKVRDINGKEHWVIHEIKSPTRKMNWNLQENVCFSAKRLKQKAHDLYKKYGKNQVIIYDEGRQGVSAARAMENLNKEMEDFFQECGFMGHVIFIVLPNFFKLHEDYAVSRSLFLIDAFKDKNKHRGYFNFYNETQKEWLYFLGKKKIGITQKYTSAHESFWGRFSTWFPFDRQEYEKAKLEGMKEKERSKMEQRWKKQRDAMAYICAEEFGLSQSAIAERLESLSGEQVDRSSLSRSLEFIRRRLMAKQNQSQEA